MNTEYTVVERNSNNAIVGTRVYPSRRRAAESLGRYIKKETIIRNRETRSYIVIVGKG